MKSKQITLPTAHRLLTSCLLCVAVLAADAKADPNPPPTVAKDGSKNLAAASNQAFGRIAAAVTMDADVNGETAAGDLVADAQLTATQPAVLGHAQIALVSEGALGKYGLAGMHYPHDVKYNEILALQPQGMALITVSLTAQQIKYVLEQQFVGCGGQTRQRMLQVSNGFSFSWKANRGPCAKIWDVKLAFMDMSQTPPIPSRVVDIMVTGGVLLNPNKTYRVTVNEFLAKGGDDFTILKDGLNPTEGVSDIDALAAYLENFKFPKPSYDPNAANLGRPRIIQLPPP